MGSISRQNQASRITEDETIVNLTTRLMDATNVHCARHNVFIDGVTFEYNDHRNAWQLNAMLGETILEVVLIEISFDIEWSDKSDLIDSMQYWIDELNKEE